MPIQFAQEAFTEHEVVLVKEDSCAAFLAALARGDYAGIQCLIRHLHDLTIGPFNAEIIKALPESLVVLGNVGAGYDQIDIAACTARNLLVTHTPDAVRDATAETAVFLTLGCVRHFGAGANRLAHGQWLGGLAPGRSLGSLTVGILGLGNIGLAIGKRLFPFDCKLQYYSRNKVQDADARMRYCETLETLLSTSHVVIVAVPLSAHTRHMLDADALGKMRQGSWLINIARGAVVDEMALVEALESGHLAGVGLDVFEREPEVHPRLLELASKQDLGDGVGSVVLLPHMGTHTTDASRLMEESSLASTLNVLGGGRHGVVPEQRSKN